jgi:cytidylate kinase
MSPDETASGESTTQEADGRPGRAAALPPAVTIAALHGSGGSEIGPRVAERLGVEFLDRAIPAAVARRAGLAEEVVRAVDERSRSAAGRWTSMLARVSNPVTASGHGVERADAEEYRIRVEIEAFVARARRSGGVILGRGGAVVLASAPGVLHVHLGGARRARVERIMDLHAVDRRPAARRVDAHDRARRDYVQSAYGIDGDDPRLYHLMLDAVSLGVDACVDLIVLASTARSGHLPPKTDGEDI